MSSSNQIIQQSGVDIECSYNIELFIVDSNAEQNNSGLIYIMGMKSSHCLVKEHYTHMTRLPLFQLPLK